MPRSVSSKSGFTLVELSVVLVIFGLILGGVIIGKEMIRTAQLRSVVTDVQQYLAASMMFQDKYNCLPGDCANATTFFSGVTNGNGNGQFNWSGAGSTPQESFSAWKELALAGFIKGNYTANAGPVNMYEALIGINVPASRLPGSGFTWDWFGTFSSNSSVYDGSYGNLLNFGAKAINSYTEAAILTPAEAYGIDLKIDDGIPGTGTVRTRYNYTNCNTGTASTAASSTYNVNSYTGVACMLFFITGW